MNNFLCALRLDGRPVAKRELFAYLTRLPRQLDWDSMAEGAFHASALKETSAMRPLLVSYRGLIGVGDVRLDNREELAAVGGCSVDESDLAIVLATIDRLGTDAVPKIYGDFSFVAWDPRARKIVAARDCFGVKPLFYRRTAEHLLISSRLEPLAGDETIDVDYVSNFLAGFPTSTPHTIWKNVLQLEPGAMLVQRGSVTAQSQYWTAAAFEPAAYADERAATEEFRQHFFESIRTRVVPNQTWAQLSGGLDSSAVVSSAEWLNEGGLPTALAGSVTVVDQLGTGDERFYVDSVSARYALRNEQVTDYWPWRNDSGAVPRASDEPSPLFPFFARDRQLVDLVTGAGGRVLLSGFGSDHYMTGSMRYLADMFAQGRIREGAKEVLSWSVQTRRSFWQTAQRNVVAPILGSLRQRNRIGRFYNEDTTFQLKAMSNWVQRDGFQDKLEVRYPFLSRRLVEYALRLPVRMKVRPGAQKWVLREAMKGILPEVVRSRHHKGGIDARVLWTLQHERPFIEELLKDPIIAQHNLVNATRLREDVERARQGATDSPVRVMSALALESWLRARSGSWPLVQLATRTAA